MPERNTSSLSGYILTPTGWVNGSIVYQGKSIVRIEGNPISSPETLPGPYIIPGFIDLHVHGGGGAFYSDGEDGIRRFIRFHAERGTVAIAPTTSTAPIATIESALADIEHIRNNRKPGEPAVLGAHLEGPFLNPGKLGAQTPMTIDGDAELARRWAGICKIIIATVAPEIPGGIAVIEALSALGCRVQVGHSLATAQETSDAFRRGLTGFTHLFNGMTGFDHREPGVAAYAMSEGKYAELICDLIHVHPEIVRAAYRAIPRLYAISDAVALAGCKDGEHGVGTDFHVVKAGNKVTLADGSSLAGSAITMLDAFRNLVSIGLSIAEASDLCSRRQAEYLGELRLGSLSPGAFASFAVLDRNLALLATLVEGEQVGEIGKP